MSGNFVKFAELGRKIVGVGRNYRDHAAELGSAIPEVPLLFMKPATSYITEGTPIKIPKGCTSLHHEIELGVVIGQKGTDIPEGNAMNHVAGYVLALDMTARDFQNVAKQKGTPWDLAKGFDTGCPVGKFIPKASISDPHNLELWCKVNGALKQKGNTKDMIFKIPYLISYISQYFTLEPYDMILTGTCRCKWVSKGDVIQGGLANLAEIKFKVVGAGGS
ncbi:Acylpyruvase FAHD1, mitochondrial [Orchesella cincta]|uniref:Oxaloacetate tautomerase FAHD1, mitochondrial n=1 Tax=Orchesella cincta TaxID=48709 RepID=A0A1D2MCI8_ORCCI|nr:Acylpyruvase FAHD1, mitochondrial [Orchesella cincta]